MKKKNSILATVIAILVILVLAAFVFVQPYLNSTAYASDDNIAAFLGVAFGKYPRFVNEKDFDKVELIEISQSDGHNYVSIALDGFIEKRDAYLEAYQAASETGSEAPEMPDFSSVLKTYQTDSKVSGFTELKNFKNLVEVNIAANIFPVSSNLEEFKDASNLKSLIISGNGENENKITDISVLSDKIALTDLALDDNAIADISALSALVNLETVSLNNNEIADISALNGKNKITSLSLATNKISDISALADMSELTSLYLDENEIADISALNGKESITTISLSKNNISDIAPVGTLKSASVISLSSNSITDVSPLTAFADVTSNVYILLTENTGITDWSVLDTLPENIMIYGKPEATEDENTEDETTDNDENADPVPSEPTDDEAENVGDDGAVN